MQHEREQTNKQNNIKEHLEQSYNEVTNNTSGINVTESDVDLPSNTSTSCISCKCHCHPEGDYINVTRNVTKPELHIYEGQTTTSSDSYSTTPFAFISPAASPKQNDISLDGLKYSLPLPDLSQDNNINVAVRENLDNLNERALQDPDDDCKHKDHISQYNKGLAV